MLFTTETVKNEDIKSINNFFSNFDNEFEAVSVVDENEAVENSVSKYITSLVSSQYQKAIEDIENTKIGNRRMRKRSLQQVMQESFFAGANRFGNNFIA
jgi:ribosomal protein S17E